MNKQAVAAGLAAALALGARAAPAQYRPPRCDLNTGHFLVNGAVTYMRAAAGESDLEKRRRFLSDARGNLLEAISRGEEENAAVWYFLGRYYKEVEDGPGADSAFARAVELAPDCGEDVDYHRQVMWVPLVNRAVDSLRAGNFDAAKDLFRSANAAWAKDPFAFYYLGRVFGNEGEPDSALVYLKRVVEIGVTDTARAELVKDAHLNVGLLLSMLAQQYGVDALWDSAAAWFRRYLEQWPEETGAMVSLAQAYDRGGKRAQALAVYDSILARAPEMDVPTLFEAGTKMFTAERFVTAARAFEMGLERNPLSRDGLYNLANTYLVIADDQTASAAERRAAPGKMLAIARRLVRLDPRNRESLRLLAGAYQLTRNSDSTLAVLERIEGMRWEVLVDFFQRMGAGGWGLSGRVVNLTAREVNVPAITFEFLDAAGNAVVSETAPAQTIGANDMAGIEFSPRDTSIVGWRYRVGS